MSKEHFSRNPLGLSTSQIANKLRVKLLTWLMKRENLDQELEQIWSTNEGKLDLLRVLIRVMPVQKEELEPREPVSITIVNPQGESKTGVIRFNTPDPSGDEEPVHLTGEDKKLADIVRRAKKDPVFN